MAVAHLRVQPMFYATKAAFPERPFSGVQYDGVYGGLQGDDGASS